eukprot:3874749-Pleurochrysis_carterae.AAC.4
MYVACLYWCMMLIAGLAGGPTNGPYGTVCRARRASLSLLGFASRNDLQAGKRMVQLDANQLAARTMIHASW